MVEFLESISLLPMVLTFACYQVGLWLRKKWDNPICNPIIVALLLVVGLLVPLCVEQKRAGKSLAEVKAVAEKVVKNVKSIGFALVLMVIQVVISAMTGYTMARVKYRWLSPVMCWLSTAAALWTWALRKKSPVSMPSSISASWEVVAVMLWRTS